MPLIELSYYQNFIDLLHDGENLAVLFYSPRCPHCGPAKLLFNDLAKEFDGSHNEGYEYDEDENSEHDSGIYFIRVNCDVFSALCDEYKIRQVPTFMIFKNKKVAAEPISTKDINVLRKYVLTLNS